MVKNGQVCRVTIKCTAPLPLGTTLRITSPQLSSQINGSFCPPLSSLLPPAPAAAPAAPAAASSGASKSSSALSSSSSSSSAASDLTIELVTDPDSHPVYRATFPIIMRGKKSDTTFRYRYALFTSDGRPLRYEQCGAPPPSGLEGGEQQRLAAGVAGMSVAGGNTAASTPFREICITSGNLEVSDVFDDYYHFEKAGSTTAESQDTATGWLTLVKNAMRKTSIESIVSSPIAEVVPAAPFSSTPSLLTSPESPEAKTISDDDRIKSTCGVDKSRLFLICYHLPVIISKDKVSGEWTAVWNANSLIAKSHGSVANAVPTFWVGSLPIPAGTTPADLDSIKALLTTMSCVPIFISQSLHDAAYLGMCKQVLWPAFHNVDLLELSMGEVNKAAPGTEREGGFWDHKQVDFWWSAYKEVNRIFCTECRRLLNPGDNAWVHDYHLALLPRLLECSEIAAYGRRTSNSVFFLHIPFPTSQIFRELECSEALLTGILSADVVGFHAFDHARHFLNACKRVMGLNYESKLGGMLGLQYRDRTVIVMMSHVSIESTLVDSAKIDVNEAAARAGDTKPGGSLKAKHGGKWIIGGIDVAQKLSGLSLKLLAFEHLLTDYPSWQRKVVLVQRVCIPQTRAADEAQTLADLRIIVRRIQDQFGAGCIDYEEYAGGVMPINDRVALWLAADVFCSTAVREGLNLLPLEYVYARDSSPGVVICSEFGAACNILNGALRVNPFDVQMTSAVMDKALMMELPERETRRARDIEFVSSRSSSKWSKHVLRELQEAVLISPNSAGIEVSESGDEHIHADVDAVCSAYNSSSSRIILLDYGGTLLAKEPPGKYLKKDISSTGGRKPRHQVLESLRTLAADPKNSVFVISGEDRRVLEAALGDIEGLGLASDNGASFAWPPSSPGAKRRWQSFQFGVDWDGVKQAAMPILSKFSTRTNGSQTKVHDTALYWSFYSSDPEWGALQAKYIVGELETALAGFDVQIVCLKGQVGIVPKKLNKGVVAARILREVSAMKCSFPDFVMGVGDDAGDEKIFSAINVFLADQVDPDSSSQILIGQVHDSDRDSATFSAADLVTTGVLGESGKGGGDENENGAGENATVVTATPTTSLLNVETSWDLPPHDAQAAQYAFTITVGKKKSCATQFLHNSKEVESLLVAMSGRGQGGNNTSPQHAVVGKKDNAGGAGNFVKSDWEEDPHVAACAFYENECASLEV